MNVKITLGGRYRETLHDREGVATAVCHFLTGCSQVKLEWKNKDGEVKDSWVDVSLIEGLEKAETDPGGPRDTPPSRDPGV